MKWFKRRKKTYEVWVRIQHNRSIIENEYITIKKIVLGTSPRNAYVNALAELELNKSFFTTCMKATRV